MRTIEASPPETSPNPINGVPSPDVVLRHIAALERELVVSKKLLKLSRELHTVRSPMFGPETATAGSFERR
jgi:hypothetical protein